MSSAAAPHGDEVSAHSEDDQSSGRWSKHDTSWLFSLVGTAIGAGILFLPMNAGQGGLWALVIVTILILPMTFLSHRALSRFVLASHHPGSDITSVAKEFFGPVAGRLVTVLYFFSIYPILLIYGVGITNTVDSLIVNQLGLDSPPRWLLAGVLVAILTGVMASGERIMLVVTQWVVWPLAVVLLGTTLYLIPRWSLNDDLTRLHGPLEMTTTVWLTIPVLVFSFSHAAAISQFSLAQQRVHGARAAHRASRILLPAAMCLVIFTMSFVFSCTLVLGVDGLADAAASNLPVLSYLANVLNDPVVWVAGPIIAIAAISSSFFGHYLGAAEGTEAIVRDVVPSLGARASERGMKVGIAIFIYVTTWIAAVLNPSILDLIDTISGPVIASILYLMPMYAIRRVPALEPYRGRLSNVFVTVAGLVAVSGIFFGFLR